MKARNVKKNRLRKWLFYLYDWLTKPSSRLIDAGLMRRSRLLSSFLIMAAIIFLAVAAIQLANDPQYISYLPQVAINFCITLIVYIFSRSRYYILAAVMTTAIVPIAIINNIYHQPAFPEIEVSLIMLVLSLLMSNLLLPIWGTVLFGMINLAIIFLMPSFQPEVIQDFTVLNRPFSINLIAAVLTVYGYTNRNQIEKKRRENLSKIADEMKHEVSERIRAEEALRKRATRLELVSEIGHNTTAIMEIDELLHKAVNLLSAAFGYSNVNLLLVEGDEIVLRAASWHALKVYEGVIRLKIGVEGINGWVAKNGESLLVNDVFTDPRYYAKMPEMQMKSELAVPIQLKNFVIGVLDAQSTEYNNFTQDDTETLRAVANQIAIAIENSRLYEAAKAELAERRQAEVALRDSETRYRGIVEDQTDMICRFQPDGNITFANEAFCRSLGVTREAIVKMNLVSQVTQENRKLVEANLGKLTFDNPVIVNEYRVEKPNGEIHWEQWWDRAFFNENGKVIEYQSVGQDITERKLAEIEIYRLNDELERRVIERTVQLRVTNQELETFAYSVSHDLRAPLRTIDGFSLALLEDYSDSVDDVGKKLLGRIRVASKKMETLIDGLLNFLALLEENCAIKWWILVRLLNRLLMN